MKFKVLWIAGMLLAATAGQSEGGFIVGKDWKVTGDQKLTLDQDTGLEWLDIDQTVNKSFTLVSSQFGTGGSFEGFRYSTEAEFRTLIANAGILSTSFVSTYYSQAVGLQNLLGATYNSSTQKNSFGILADSAISNFDRRGVDLMTTPSGYSVVDFGDQTNAAWQYKGSWLVRETASTVPEPASIAMWGLGALGMMFARRKRRQMLMAV